MWAQIWLQKWPLQLHVFGAPFSLQKCYPERTHLESDFAPKMAFKIAWCWFRFCYKNVIQKEFIWTQIWLLKWLLKLHDFWAPFSLQKCYPEKNHLSPDLAPKITYKFARFWASVLLQKFYPERIHLGPDLAPKMALKIAWFRASFLLQTCYPEGTHKEFIWA